MSMTTKIKQATNNVLSLINLRIDTLTAERAEQNRISATEDRGGFQRAIYSTPANVLNFDPSLMLTAYSLYAGDLARLNDPRISSTGYNPQNPWFRSPDAEILYLLVRALKPHRIIEIGCGNSTKISRQAILDGALATQIIAIDPAPRSDIADLVDRFERKRLEEVDDATLFSNLSRDDILFIDSSHEARVGNDVAHLFCRIIPSLPSGVIVHVHDVFLPFDCPAELARIFPNWGEQYILHALLVGGNYQVLWPGYYVQRMKSELLSALPFLTRGHAKSFWFRSP